MKKLEDLRLKLQGIRNTSFKIYVMEAFSMCNPAWAGITGVYQLQLALVKIQVYFTFYVFFIPVNIHVQYKRYYFFKKTKI